MSDAFKRLIPIYLILGIYIFVSILFSMTTLSNLYINFLNPLFLLLISILVFSITNGFKIRKRNKYSKNIILLIIGFCIIYFLSGLLFGFKYNSLLDNGFIINFISLFLVILFKEYIRYRLLSTAKKNKDYILITGLFIILDISYISIINNSFINYIFSDLFKIIILNVTSSYLILNVNYLSNYLYRSILGMIMFLLPIVPNFAWYVESLFLLIFLIIVNVLVDRYSILEERKGRKRKKENPILSSIILVSVIIFASFMFGFFKYQPISILSNSMKDYYSKGDVVIVEKITKEDIQFIEKDDIIYYRYDNKYITHRVYEKELVNGEYVFYTKGDNNEFVDNWEVYDEDIIGVVKFRIKYLGWPSVLLNDLLS